MNFIVTDSYFIIKKIINSDVCNLDVYNSFKSLKKNGSFRVSVCSEIGYVFALPYLPRMYMEIVFVQKKLRSYTQGCAVKLQFQGNEIYLNLNTTFISVINQLDAQNFCFTVSLFHASTCFEQMCSSSGGQKFITQPLESSHYVKMLCLCSY